MEDTILVTAFEENNLGVIINDNMTCSKHYGMVFS